MANEKRRSPRFAVRVFLLVGWKVGEETIVRNAVSESINEHGALLKLMAECAPIDRVILVNVVNHEEQKARVVMVEPVRQGAGTYTLRVEFEAPAPQFWGMIYFHSRDGFETHYIPEGCLTDPVRGASRRLGAWRA